MSQSRGIIVAVCVLCAGAAAARADDQAPASTPAAPTQITIFAPYQPHNGLSPSTGSSTYIFDDKAIDNLPQGDDTSLNNVLLQAPGVAQDSFGQLHVRGDHADLQYRINGIILPEGITGFGQTLDTHFAEKVDLLTGALPAQFGYRTAGIVDITTKTGSFGNGGVSSIMGGTSDTLQGNQELYGTSGNANYYFSGTYLQNNRGIEPPTAAINPIHDDTTQDKEFGYMSYAFNPENRMSVIVGNSTNRFQIPNNPGQPQNFTLTGTPDFPSSNLNENQYEHNTYAIAALQGSLGDDVDYQLAAFTRYSTVYFKPDPIGDLIFNGIASTDYRESQTSGLQNDYSYRINGSNVIRGGWTYSYATTQSDSSSSVFNGFFDAGTDQIVQTGTTPFTVIDNSSLIAQNLGVYLQDEWQATDKLTINYGARVDGYQSDITTGQVSPRIGAIYDLTQATKLHAGYARYFTPPETELIAPVTVQNFTNTTGALPTTGDSPVQPERDDYFDAGVIQKLGHDMTFGVDAYYKHAHDLLDEGQFGQALIFAPFNYETGYVKGVEFTGDYKHDALSAYANLALSQAMGKGLASGQFNFSQDEIDYINANAVHLDHDQLITGSAGATYLFRDVKYGADVLFGSGLRDGFANTEHLPFYTQVNAGVEHTFDFGPQAGALDAKLSIINLLDRIYEIRDGTGIGVFAPQFGPRRGVFLELSKPFTF